MTSPQLRTIKLSGSKGVAAEGKQMAVESDKVVGMDTHIMVVPTGNGTTTVPLPHPFIGKLKDKLAKVESFISMPSSQ